MRREHAASVTTPCTSPMNAASKQDLRGVTSRCQPLARLMTILAIATTTYAAETAIRLGTREAFPSLHLLITRRQFTPVIARPAPRCPELR